MTMSLSLVADVYRRDARYAPHRHEELQLSLVLSGRVRETVGTTTEEASALSVVCKPAGVLHADDFGPSGARIARLTFPFHTLDPLLDDVRRCPGWRWTHQPTIAAPFLRLLHQHGVDQGAPIAADDPDLLDLLAALTAQPTRATRGTPPVWLADIIATLHEEWTPQWRVGDVARRAGVHPVYLARCVRRWFGCSVGDLLRTERLRAAIARCAEGNGTISDAAHASGFADEAHLNRAVRAAAGMTPGRFRALVGSFSRASRNRE